MALPLATSAPRVPPLRHRSAAVARAALSCAKGQKLPLFKWLELARAQHAHGARLAAESAVRAGIIHCTGWHHLGPLLDAHPLSSGLHCFPVFLQTTSTNNLVALVLLTFLGASSVSGLVYSPNSFETNSLASVRRTSAGMSGIAPRSVLMLQQQLKGPCAARFFCDEHICPRARAHMKTNPLVQKR